MDFTAIVIVFILFGLPTLCLSALLMTRQFFNFRNKELAVRRVEAEACIEQARASLDAPAWLDRNDLDALAEWKRAKYELDTAAARAAIS